MLKNLSVYEIKTKVDGKEAVPDLTHLENALKDSGFTCTVPLKILQKGDISLSLIENTPYDLNYVKRKSDGKFVLFAYYRNYGLNEFAKNYEPQPLS